MVRHKNPSIPCSICGRCRAQGCVWPNFIRFYIWLAILRVVCGTDLRLHQNFPIVRKNSQVADEFKRYVSWFKRRTECTVKLLNSDNKGEYIALNTCLLDEVVEVKRSSPNFPIENGTAERANRVIAERARSTRSYAGLPRRLWAEAVVHADNIRNRSCCPRRKDMSSYDMMAGHKLRIDHLSVFGPFGCVHTLK